MGLEGEILTLCGHINAAEYRFLKLLAEYDRACGWSRHGVASCVQWLNWQCGMGAVATPGSGCARRVPWRNCL
jgi:hypothetical protein